MKVTYSLTKFIYTELYKYAEQLDIKPEDVPELLLTRKEVLAHSGTIGGRNTRHFFGICYREEKLIFLNIKHALTRQGLRHTIIHELVHYRFPYLRHGGKFDERIFKILKGKRYPKVNHVKNVTTKHGGLK